ncbi:hypothetical protein CORC01_01356 [Colletotrichum orchidophilum]|uniref:DUF6536 domain-containing protein n=1 Tax=Colletotrichum orchidophilum TaxID=1209926 RepID=A0A1G4BPS5_9PEZI|nr:uncharacterized protein CORC01_01356 [Colletotrichum orchidophilum]OHF03303.1 hypothetical protein CORC01_01356 [Colletotrichum orchidophilum]
MGRSKISQSRWRQASFYFSIAAFSTFLINFIFTLWASITRRDTIRDGVGTLLDTGCSTIRTLNTGIHILINVLGIILLAGSNYCMQCLMAPTRPEIDDAHARQDWLDIGVPSVRNFWSITWKKKTVWILLSISSLPLHLVSTSVNNYSVLNTNAYISKNSTGSTVSSAEWKSMYAGFLGDNVEQMDVTKCIDAYRVAFQSSRGNLLLVSDDRREENRTVELAGILAGNSTCEDYLLELRTTPGSWTPLGSAVTECYSQKTEEHCKLAFSSALCWTVTAFNFAKGVLMLFVAFGMGDEDPIMTIGDAVASFLQHRDESTADMCLKSKDHFVAQLWSKGPIQYDLKPQRKSVAVTPGGWFLCFSLYLGLIIACAYLLIGGLYHMSGGGDIIKLGLGAMQTSTILSTGNLGQGSILANILLVNTPQIVLSLIYFTYNAQYTSISLITEWDRYGNENESKSLRVSSTRKGSQRDTYFLQLPYRYSLPLVIFSGGLHWLISQSFFLVNLEVYAPSDDATSMVRVTNGGSRAGVTACGWSPLGVLCVLVVIILMMGFLIITERRRLRFGAMPVAGSCSAAISATCHPDSDEEKMWEKPLRWGVVDSSVVGHCSFSSEPVSVPVRGRLYS